MEPAEDVALAAPGSENRIAEVRGARGLKQADLARQLDISRGQLANIESGTRKVDLPELRRIALALNCSVIELLLESDAPNQPSPEEIDILKELRSLNGYDARAVLLAAKSVIAVAGSVRDIVATPKSLEGDPALARAMSDRWRGLDDIGRKKALQLLDTAREFGA